MLSEAIQEESLPFSRPAFIKTTSSLGKANPKAYAFVRWFNFLTEVSLFLFLSWHPLIIGTDSLPL